MTSIVLHIYQSPKLFDEDSNKANEDCNINKEKFVSVPGCRRGGRIFFCVMSGRVAYQVCLL